MSDNKKDKWEMPTPVFRSSTGSLPKCLEDTISHSLMPNAEIIEIDEDDDILSIMDTPGKGQEANVSEFSGGETILEIGSAIAPAAESPANVDGSTAKAAPKPLSVTANDHEEESAISELDDTKSNLVLYIVVAAIVAGIIAAVLYYQSRPV